MWTFPISIITVFIITICEGIINIAFIIARLIVRFSIWYLIDTGRKLNVYKTLYVQFTSCVCGLYCLPLSSFHWWYPALLQGKLHKKWNFPLRISSVSVTKTQVLFQLSFSIDSLLFVPLLNQTKACPKWISLPNNKQPFSLNFWCRKDSWSPDLTWVAGINLQIWHNWYAQLQYTNVPFCWWHINAASSRQFWMLSDKVPRCFNIFYIQQP